MTTRCVLYTQDIDLARRIAGLLGLHVRVQHIEEAPRLQAACRQFNPTLVLMDLRARESRMLLARVRQDYPDTLIIALGSRDSDPALEAEALDVYAIEDPAIDRRRLQALVRRALDHLRLLQELRLLRSTPAPLPAAPGQGVARTGPLDVTQPLHQFSHAFRHFDKVEALLETIVEGVARLVRVSRIGVFAAARGNRSFRLRAGLKCLDTSRQLEVPPDDPLPLWLEANAHLVARANLPHIDATDDRAMLEEALDTFGAEAIVPLHGHSRVLGWLFVGRSTTGVPWEQADLDRLSVLGDDISLALENALLYEEVAVQKNLAETVLHAIPVGIVACDSSGLVSWFNAAAERILGLERNAVLNGPVATVGGAPR